MQPGVALEGGGGAAPAVQASPGRRQVGELAFLGDEFGPRGVECAGLEGRRAHRWPCTSAAVAGLGTEAGRAGSPADRRGRTSSTSPPSSPPALAPTRPVTVGDGEDAEAGFTARENDRSWTWVLFWLALACWVSERVTALAMSAAWSGWVEVAE